MKIAVIYFTKTNVTGALAKAIIEEIKSRPDMSVLEHRIEGKEIYEGRFFNPALFEKLLTCDAMIMGTPTYMGGPSAQFKAFVDASSGHWNKQLWAGKIAAGFTSGTGLNGDQTGTLNYLATFSNQHGMIWVGLDLAQGGAEPQPLNRLCCQIGIVAESVNGRVNEIDVRTAKYLGGRVADFVNKLSSSKV